MRGLVFVLVLLLLVGCSTRYVPETPDHIETDEVNEMALKISSPAFGNNEDIPAKYTCQGDDISPPLKFEGIPTGTKSLVLICDDPDAPGGNWDHWIIYNILPTVTEISENSVPEGAIEATNSWGAEEYGGPCPPSGKHRYFFKLFALDIILTLDTGSDKKDVEEAMEGHIIEKAEMIGLYQKS